MPPLLVEPFDARVFCLRGIFPSPRNTILDESLRQVAADINGYGLRRNVQYCVRAGTVSITGARASIGDGSQATRTSC